LGALLAPLAIAAAVALDRALALGVVSSQAALALLGAGLVVLAAGAFGGTPCGPKAAGRSGPRKATVKQGGTFDDYEDPLRWGFVGDGTEHRANLTTPVVHENPQCVVKAIAMHRPTHEPWREETGDYPFAWHLAGRKRTFEIRLQMRLKRKPEGTLHFGIVLRKPGKSSSMGRMATSLLLGTARLIIGDFYQSHGDDPDDVQGEAEPPTFVMPLWAFDQFVVSEAGDEPDLAGDLEGLGTRRTDSVAAYTQAMKATIGAFSTDKVYTFCFWGGSQFLDCIRWEMVGSFLPFTGGKRMDFCAAGCEPPINVVAYEMPGVSPEDPDRRHLLSRKRYYFNVVMWSQLRTPAPGVLRSFLGPGAERQEDAALQGGPGAPGSQRRRRCPEVAEALDDFRRCCCGWPGLGTLLGLGPAGPSERGGCKPPR